MCGVSWRGAAQHGAACTQVCGRACTCTLVRASFAARANFADGGGGVREDKVANEPTGLVICPDMTKSDIRQTAMDA